MYEKNVINEKENYNFLVIRKDKKPTEGFYRLNFDKILDAYDYYWIYLFFHFIINKWVEQ